MKDTECADLGNAPLAAFEAGLKSQTPEEVMPGIFIHHRDLVVSDQTASHQKIAKREERGPVNPSGTLTLHTLESFVGAVTDHQDKRTKIFADSEAGLIVSVFDFLENGGKKDETDFETRARGWGQLRAELAFKESRKLKEWRQTLEWLTQETFANFLEDHLEDIVSPTGQDLLALVTDLEASLGGSFKGKTNLANGSVKFAYMSDVETSVEVPKELVLGIPLFEHGDAYKLKVRLRFNITGQGVRFRLLFTNLEDAKQLEFERIVQEIEEKTVSELYRGKLALPW
jgi:hypothetical protein